MYMNNVIWSIITGEKLSGSFFTLLFVFLAAVQCQQHYFVTKLERNVGRSVEVSIMCLEDFGLKEIVFGFRDVCMYLYDKVPCTQCFLGIRRCGLGWSWYQGRD